MKVRSIYITSLVMVALLTIALACKLVGRSSAPYSSATDKFSIAFPGGPSGVETKTEEVKYARAARNYEKSFDNRSDKYRSYEVQVLDLFGSQTENKTPREILEIALNGWEDEPETEIKEITVDGRKGIDSLRTVSIGSVSMTFREVVFWSEPDKRLYVVKVSASKKENTQTAEANEFVNSFKLTA